MNQDTYDSNPVLVEKIKSVGGNITIREDIPTGVISLDGVLLPVDAAEARLDEELRRQRILAAQPNKVNVGILRNDSARNYRRVERKLQQQRKRG